MFALHVTSWVYGIVVTYIIKYIIIIIIIYELELHIELTSDDPRSVQQFNN